MPILREVEALVVAGASVGGSPERDRFAQRLNELRGSDKQEGAVVERLQSLRLDLERQMQTQLVERTANLDKEAKRVAELEAELLARDTRLEQLDARLTEREQATAFEDDVDEMVDLKPLDKKKKRRKGSDQLLDAAFR